MVDIQQITQTNLLFSDSYTTVEIERVVGILMTNGFESEPSQGVQVGITERLL